MVLEQFKWHRKVQQRKAQHVLVTLIFQDRDLRRSSLQTLKCGCGRFFVKRPSGPSEPLVHDPTAHNENFQISRIWLFPPDTPPSKPFYSTYYSYNLQCATLRDQTITRVITLNLLGRTNTRAFVLLYT
jgi:hypothetical protein